MSPANNTRRPARPAASPARKPGATRPAASPSARRLPIALLVGAALAVGLIAVIVLTMGSGEEQTLEVGTPTVTGEALPRFDSTAGDTAVGVEIPEVTGADFAGTPVAITRDGRPKVLMFFAHWCGVCRQEVPLVADWLPGAALPENLDLISVSTGIRANQVNYPPSEWFAAEGWTVPLIMDDAADSVGRAFGLSAYPYFVFVDADGKVFYRATGGLPTETIEAIIASMLEA